MGLTTVGKPHALLLRRLVAREDAGKKGFTLT